MRIKESGTDLRKAALWKRDESRHALSAKVYPLTSREPDLSDQVGIVFSKLERGV
jgi:hypothetical protein